jgi:hypothetical protein
MRHTPHGLFGGVMIERGHTPDLHPSHRAGQLNSLVTRGCPKLMCGHPQPRGECRLRARQHGASMSTPRRRPVRRNTPHDARRTGVPRDYLTNPAAFGRLGGFEFSMPPNGDELSARLAALQHGMVAVWNAEGRRPKTTMLRAIYGVSRQTFSDITLGKRWAGGVGFAMLLAACVPFVDDVLGDVLGDDDALADPEPPAPAL